MVTKIRWVYLKNNPLGLKVVKKCIKVMKTREIMKFIQENMDIDKIYDQATKKIKMFYDSLDWGKPVDKEKQ